MKNYQEKVKPYQVGTRAALTGVQGGNPGDLKSEAAFRNARVQRRVATQVCPAIQLNYTSRVQTMFSKWQLLTKLRKEDRSG